MMFCGINEKENGSLLSYFIIFTLLFSQSAIASYDCKHALKSDSDMSSTVHNQSHLTAQDKLTEHCHLKKTKHNTNTQVTSESASNVPAACCDKPCAHCQVLNTYMYNGFTQSDYNFELSTDKKRSIYPDLKYVSHKTEPLIPPPIS